MILPSATLQGGKVECVRLSELDLLVDVLVDLLYLLVNGAAQVEGEFAIL